MSKLSKSIPPTPKSVLSEEYFESDRKEDTKSSSLPSSDRAQHVIPAPPSSPTPENLVSEVELLRKVLKSQLRARVSTPDFKHMYTFSTGATPTDGAAVFNAFNTIAAGTTQNTRVGNAIYNHSLTIRLNAFYLSNPVLIAALQPSQWRLVVFRTAVPDATPPIYTDIFSQAASIPIVDPNAMFVTLSAGDMLAVRNPNTFDFYHILHDEIINMTHTPVVAASTTGYMCGAHTLTRHIDLNNSKTTFFSTGATNIVTNQLAFALISNGATANGGNFNIEYTTDFVFSDAPNT